jgi:hypothetical protein
MAAADALFVFFDIAASTLIFIKPADGGIHRVVFGTFTLFAIYSVLVMARSAIYLLTKRCVVIGLKSPHGSLSVSHTRWTTR